jgi:hypothetical protein
MTVNIVETLLDLPAFALPAVMSDLTGSGVGDARNTRKTCVNAFECLAIVGYFERQRSSGGGVARRVLSVSPRGETRHQVGLPPLPNPRTERAQPCRSTSAP